MRNGSRAELHSRKQEMPSFDEETESVDKAEIAEDGEESSFVMASNPQRSQAYGDQIRGREVAARAIKTTEPQRAKRSDEGCEEQSVTTRERCFRNMAMSGILSSEVHGAGQ